jgi:hypothetical protein
MYRDSITYCPTPSKIQGVALEIAKASKRIPGLTTLSFDLLLKLAPVKPIAPLSAALLRFRAHP